MALGGVAHKPWRDMEAEAALRGQPASEAAFAHAADRVLHDARGYAHNAFKIDLARRAIVRTLTQAAQAHAAIAVGEGGAMSRRAGAGRRDFVSTIPANEQAHDIVYRRRDIPHRRPRQGHR